MTKKVTIVTIGILFFFATLLAQETVCSAPDLRKATQLDLPNGKIEVPIEIIGDTPVIEVMVNGEGPYRFWIDTGAAGGGSVSQKLVEHFVFEEIDEVMTGDPSGKNPEMRKVVRVNELTFAGVTVRSVPMLAAGALQEPEEADGILGFGLFEEVLLTLDYPKKKLRLETGQLPAVDGSEILEFTAEHGIPNIVIDVSGVRLSADIDSGSMGWILVPEGTVKKLPLAAEPRVIGQARTPFNTFDIKQAALSGTVRIGKHRLEHPPIEFAEIFPVANLGGQLLNQFAVTFDQKNRRVRFLREQNTPLVQQPRYRVGIMFMPEEKGLQVDGTAPGSPGEKAGLEQGDVVTSINGTPVADIGSAEMRKIFGAPQEIVLTVQRGGEKFEVRLIPERMGG